VKKANLPCKSKPKDTFSEIGHYLQHCLEQDRLNIKEKRLKLSLKWQNKNYYHFRPFSEQPCAPRNCFNYGRNKFQIRF
jgi:hypothetical protein